MLIEERVFGENYRQAVKMLDSKEPINFTCLLERIIWHWLHYNIKFHGTKKLFLNKSEYGRSKNSEWLSLAKASETIAQNFPSITHIRKSEKPDFILVTSCGEIGLEVTDGVIQSDCENDENDRRHFHELKKILSELNICASIKGGNHFKKPSISSWSDFQKKLNKHASENWGDVFNYNENGISLKLRLHRLSKLPKDPIIAYSPAVANWSGDAVDESHGIILECIRKKSEKSYPDNTWLLVDLKNKKPITTIGECFRIKERLENCNMGVLSGVILFPQGIANGVLVPNSTSTARPGQSTRG